MNKLNINIIGFPSLAAHRFIKKLELVRDQVVDIQEPPTKGKMRLCSEFEPRTNRQRSGESISTNIGMHCSRDSNIYEDV